MIETTKNNIQSDKILIAVIANRHANALKQLLESLEELSSDNASKHPFSLAIVDQDVEQSALHIAEAFGRNSFLNIAYFANKRKRDGQSLARNIAIDHAASNGYKFIVFVDEESTVSSEWLEQLMAIWKENQSSIVFGNYKSNARKPGRRPPPKTQQKFERRKLQRPGNIGSVLMPIQNVGKIRFNPRLDRTGGEDIRFFYQIQDKGYSFAMADKAISTMTLSTKTPPLWTKNLQSWFKQGVTQTVIAKRKSTHKTIAIHAAFGGVQNVTSILIDQLSKLFLKKNEKKNSDSSNSKYQKYLQRKSD